MRRCSDMRDIKFWSAQFFLLVVEGLTPAAALPTSATVGTAESVCTRTVGTASEVAAILTHH
jgi:hypothetical protein